MSLEKFLNSAKVLAAKVGNTGATIRTDGDLTIAEAKILQDAGLTVVDSKKERGDRVYKLKAK